MKDPRIPPAGGIWKKTLGDPGAVLNMLPDNERWNELKSRLQDNFNRLDTLRRDLRNKDGAYVLPNESKYSKLYDRLRMDYTFLTEGIAKENGIHVFDPNNARHRDAFNKGVEKQWVKYESERPDNESESDFLEWYFKNTERYIKRRIVSLLMTVLSVITVLNHDMRMKKALLDYQNWALKTHRFWNQFLVTQIDEQTALLENMDALLSTQRRRSVFANNDMSSLAAWRTWTTRVFALLCVATLIVLMAQKRDVLLGIVQRARVLAS